MTEDLKQKLNAKLLDMAKNADWVTTNGLKFECGEVRFYADKYSAEVYISNQDVDEYLTDTVKVALMAAGRRTWRNVQCKQVRPSRQRAIKAFLADDKFRNVEELREAVGACEHVEVEGVKATLSFQFGTEARHFARLMEGSLP